MPNAQDGAPINQTVNAPSVNHSNFNLSKKFACTPRFGVNTPFYSVEVVPDDGPITINPSCDLRSLSLKAPMFGKLKKHVSFYQVPLQAILPLNWEKIVTNPSRGTDVSGESSATGVVPCLDGVNTVVSNFVGRLQSRLVSDTELLFDILYDEESEYTSAQKINAVLSYVIRWEMFFSNGNLLSHLGIHYGNLVRYRTSASSAPLSFDSGCEYLFSLISRCSWSMVDDEGSSSVSSGFGIPHIRRCLDFMRQHSGPFVVYVTSGSQTPIKPTYFQVDVSRISEDDTEPLNYGRCCAYQIVNAHYLTNDKIDYIYSAELYRQYISSFLDTSIGFSNFSWNGLTLNFDYLSGYYFNEVLTLYLSYSFYDIDVWLYYPYFNAILGFNYSLRYMDYFVGGRPRNLAIGDTSVGVDNNTVQVVDITKNIAKQRFLNAVARVGSSIEDYSQQIFGKAPSYDWHNPKYLFSFDVDVFNSEIENTGASQMSSENSITSILHGEFSNHEFTLSVDRHSFIIGIEFFDFERFYCTTQERNTMAIDRFDMFIPELQYVGDQELRRSELITGSTKELPFAYQLRDMQFKQSFDDCAGGFVDYLPGWLFMYNPYDMTTRASSELVISPEFIRSQPRELDGFYLSLTRANLAGYFHFVEVWDINVSAKRPMAFSPQIL